MRTVPRPKIALCMTSAMIIPRSSSSATEITVTKVVLKTSYHQALEVRTVW